MELNVHINADNAAMKEPEAVADVLRKLADDVYAAGIGNEIAIRDLNGNTVGHARWFD
jgi:hypothetical protein